MSFLFPGFLISMVLLVLPILLHLWSIRRAKQKFFSNITLLKKVSIITNKTNRLKHLLLLCMRLLFLFCLTIAFAQLYKNRLLTTESNLYANKYKIDASCSVLSSQDTKRKLSSFFEKIGQENEKTSLDCKSSTNHLSDFLQESANNLFVVSDFQKSFVDLNVISPEITRLTLVKVDNEFNLPNIYIDSIWLEEHYFRMNEKNVVWTSVRNMGDADASDILIELKVDGKTIASQITSIPKRAEKRLSFHILGQHTKPLLCSIQVNDGSWDFDNVFSFVLTPAKNLQITLITDQQENNPIKIAYDQEPFFRCKVNKSSFNQEEMEDSDLLILQKRDEPSRVELLQILREVKKGKTLVILPAVKWSKATFELLNSELGTSVFTRLSTEKDSIKELDKLDPQNPFFSKIFNQVPDLAQFPLVKPICILRSADEIILRTKDGNPALGFYELGKGRVFAFSFGLKEEESFSRDAIFLPVFYRIAESAIINSLPHYLRQGQKQIVLKLPAEEVDNVYSLSNSEARIVTEQRVMGNKAILNLPHKMSLGFWHIIDKHNVQLASFGYNIEKAESDMSFYTRDELVSKYKQNENVKIVEFKELDRLLADKEKGVVSKIWRYVVGISFLFLLFEILVARFYNRNNAAAVQSI